MRNALFFLFLSSSIFSYGQSPSVEVLTSGTKTSLRGLSVVNENVIWVSGNNGMVGKSLNGGKNWNWFTIKGFENKEFRDIEAFSSNVAIIMAIGDPAYILKTTDGGESWRTVYENKTKGMFLDAMDFMSGKIGMVVGDPINDKPFLAKTIDGGETWQEIKDHRVVTDSGEAFFAASGSNLRVFKDDRYYIVSGGMKSSLITEKGKSLLPIMQGRDSRGANSIDVLDNGMGKDTDHMIIVGGDFSADSITEKTCFISSNGGKTWKEPKEGPHGYRSCVEYLSKDDILACGLNGVDYSYNGGRTWKLISKEGFHVCKIARIGSAIFLAGGNGKIGKIVWK